MKNKNIQTLLVLLASLIISNLSFGESYREGEHYEVLEKPGTVEVPGKIEVREFFWFGCPHCYALEGAISEWSKNLPKDVNFVATPTPMNSSWVNHANAYYVAESLGKLQVIKPALFKQIHVDNEPTKTKSDLAKFFSRYDVSEEKFNKVFDSFSIQVKVRQAAALTKAYQLRGVPTVVVNGKYSVKTKQNITPQDMVNIIDFLIEKERIASELSQAKLEY